MRQALKNNSIKIVKTFIFPIILWMVFAGISLAMHKMSFFDASAFSKIFRDSVLTTIVAFAIGLPLSSGRWDFSVGIIMILSAIIGSNLTVQYGLGLFGLIVITISSSVILAVIEGLLYVTFKVPTMIMSLVVVLIYESITGMIFNGQGAQLYMYTDLTVLARSPWIYIILGIVLLGFGFINRYTTYALHLKALGSNADLAVNRGVKEKKIILLTYVIVGVLLGVAAIINASTNLVAPASNLSSTSLMFASMGPVLIGLYLARYSNMTLGILAGSLTMNTLSFALVALGSNSSVQIIILGLFILFFMGYTTNLEKINNYIKKLFRKKTDKHDNI